MTDKTKRLEFEIEMYSGTVTDSNGYTYDDAGQFMRSKKLDMCGCGRPEDNHEFILACLKCINEDGDKFAYEQIEELVKKHSETVTEIILHFLDSKGLTEHGGSVYGSWLTEAGKQFLEIGVRPDPPDDDEQEEFF